MDTRAAPAERTLAPPPRVVVNGRFLAQPQTGVQRYARETLLALDRLLASRRAGLPDGTLVQLAVPRGTAVPALSAIQTVVLPRWRGHLWEQLSLAWFARGAVLVGFSYSGPVVKRRQLITVHDATVAAMPSCFSSRYRLVHNTLLALLRRRVAAVMTVSEFSLQEIARHFGITGRVVVGREGWAHAVAAPDGTDDAAVLQRHGLRPGGYVLFVGSLKPNKNLGLLPRVLDALPDFPLTIAVAGAADPRVFNQAQALPDAVRLLGFVKDAELGLLYRHAAWFVLPSLYEGFGLPAIEAMGNGCPVLSARAGSLPEVCGDAALYFDPLEPASLAGLLRRVVQEPGLREAAVSRHGARLAHYTWEHNAEILAREIARLLGPQPAPTPNGLAAPPAPPVPKWEASAP